MNQKCQVLFYSQDFSLFLNDGALKNSRLEIQGISY